MERGLEGRKEGQGWEGVGKKLGVESRVLVA